MAVEKILQYAAQERGCQVLLLQHGQCQVQARHMYATGLRVIEADTGIGFGIQALVVE
ncbi:hypothetical protein D3C81_1760560 [compost metagenome]